MNDGFFFSPEQKMLYICTEDNLFLLESSEEDITRYFWAEEKELELLEEVLENWTEERLLERERVLQGNWL
jgi:hypothetical protein